MIQLTFYSDYSVVFGRLDPRTVMDGIYAYKSRRGYEIEDTLNKLYIRQHTLFLERVRCQEIHPICLMREEAPIRSVRIREQNS